MWRPRSYADIQAAIGDVVEDSQLDFKRELGSNSREVAKDIASMTIEGGVIAYGIDEQNGIATALPNVALAGAPERIQQIVDTSIKPVPGIEIDVFPAPSRAGDRGVVVVTVPPSPLAPHYTDERFPARSGVTTRKLTEAEIDALYQQRRRMSAGADDAARPPFMWPEGAVPVQGGIAAMRLLVWPFATVRHPLGARTGRPLSSAVVEAATTMSQYVDPHLTAHAFDWLSEWRPRDTLGWQAGSSGGGYGALADTMSVAATYSHSGSFSFQVQMSVTAEGSVQRVAFEHLWAVELMACLCIAGTFLREVRGIGIVHCDLEIEGLYEAVSWQASLGQTFTPRQLRITEHAYEERGQFGTRELSNDPRDAARLLLDRLLASLLDEGTDLIADVGRGIVPTRPRGAPSK